MSLAVRQDLLTTLEQIGPRNVLAISGGRIRSQGHTLLLPVKYGYRVAVDYMSNDTYTVRREFVRGGRTTVKQAWTYVHCDQIGEVAYQASCYQDN